MIAIAKTALPLERALIAPASSQRNAWSMDTERRSVFRRVTLASAAMPWAKAANASPARPMGCARLGAYHRPFRSDGGGVLLKCRDCG